MSDINNKSSVTLKRKRKKNLIVILSILLIVLIGVFFSLLFNGNSKDEEILNNQNDDIVSEKEDAFYEEEVFLTTTKYCDLAYPQKWKTNVEVVMNEGDNYSVKYMTKEGVDLFEIYFDSEKGDILGTIKNGNTCVALSVVVSEIDNDNDNYNEILTMQEDMNVIINYLDTKYQFMPGEVVDNDNISTYAIKTPVVTLYYPKKWEDVVNVDVKDTAVSFSYKDTKLFDIYFGDLNGNLIGTYKDKKIGIVSHSIDSDGLSKEDTEIALEMQESVNVIIENLKLDAEFEEF